MSDDETVRIRIRLEDSKRFKAQAVSAGKDVKGLGDEVEKAGAKGRRAGGDYKFLRQMLVALVPAAAIAGLGLLVQVTSAAAGGAVGLTSALAPLAGLLVGAAVLGVAAGQGLGVLALGLHGVTDAVGGLNHELDPAKFAALSRPAQDFALVLDGLKGPIRSLQEAVQRGLFPGLEDGLRSAAPAIAALQGPLAGTGRILGSLGARLGALVGSSGFLADLRTQAEFNNRQLGRLGGAGLHVVNVFRNLMVAARPLVDWMTRLVAGWAAAADRAVSLGRSSGGLGRLFDAVRVTADRVVRIVADLAVALWNVGRIAKRELGDSLLVSLTRGAEKLKDWTGSADGIGRLTQFFRDAKPVVYAVAALLGDIALGFLSFGAGGQPMADLITKVRTELLPALGDLARTLTAVAGPGLVDLAIALADAFTALAPAIIGIAVPLTGMVKGLTWLVENVPGLSEAITVLTGVWVGYKVAAGLAALAQRGLNTAMKLSPFWRVVTVLIAVGTALYEAYQRSETFRNAVQGVWQWIQEAWPKITSVIGDIVRPIGTAISKFNDLRQTVSRAVSGIADRFRDLIAFLGRVPGAIGGAIGSLPGKALDLLGVRAEGGPIYRTGSYLVGERGPEIVTLPGGSYVTPNHQLAAPRLAAPRVATVHHAPPAAGAQTSGPIHVQVASTLVMPNGDVLAESVDGTVIREAARS